MAPNTPIEVEQEQPLSRTFQYRKVMKPMLERKRRARINKCLDELKDLMVSALANEGENVTKLEKADVLELTVRHLRKLKQNRLLGVLNPGVLHERYMAGFAHCATQVGSFLNACTPAESGASARLMNHVSNYMQTMDKMSPSVHTAAINAQLPSSGARVMTPPMTPPGHHHMLPMHVQCQLSPQGSLPPSALSPSGSEGSFGVPMGSPVSSEINYFRDSPERDSNSSMSAQSEDDKVWRPW